MATIAPYSPYCHSTFTIPVILSETKTAPDKLPADPEKVLEILRDCIKNYDMRKLEKYIKDGIKLPQELILNAILTENKSMIDFIIQHCDVLEESDCITLKKLGYKKGLNIARNILIKKAINTKNNKIYMYMREFFKDIEFQFDFDILRTTWKKICSYIFDLAINHNCIITMNNLFDKFKLDDSQINTLLYKFYGLYSNKIYFFEKLINYSKVNNQLKLIKEKLISLYPIDYIRINICSNIGVCNKGVNKESLNSREWKEIFNDEEPDIIYRSNDNYIFSVKELFKFWDIKLNNFDYHIKPIYPKDPYTNKLMEPIELYKIIKIANEHDISIPYNLLTLIKNPKCIYDCYNSKETSSTTIELYFKQFMVYNNDDNEWNLCMETINKRNDKDYILNDKIDNIVLDILMLSIKNMLKNSYTI